MLCLYFRENLPSASFWAAISAFFASAAASKMEKNWDNGIVSYCRASRERGIPSLNLTLLVLGTAGCAFLGFCGSSLLGSGGRSWRQQRWIIVLMSEIIIHVIWCPVATPSTLKHHLPASSFLAAAALANMMDTNRCEWTSCFGKMNEIIQQDS